MLRFAQHDIAIFSHLLSAGPPGCLDMAAQVETPVPPGERRPASRHSTDKVTFVECEMAGDPAVPESVSV